MKTWLRTNKLNQQSVPCLKYKDDEGLFVIESRRSGFEMDWTLGNDITLCEFNLECDAGEYAIYNLEGNLVAERSESLKVEFADQKRSFRQFSYYFHIISI